MRKAVFIFASICLSTVGLQPAVSLPLAPVGASPATPDVTRVWDHCGVGRHRTAWGQCISNFAHFPGSRSCPPGFHLGYSVHRCLPG